MKNTRLAMGQASLVGALALAGSFAASDARAQHGHSPSNAPTQEPATPEQLAKANALVEIVREATKPFQNIATALAAGYVPRFGCVSGSHEGAMGVHLVHDPLVGDVGLDPTKPELLVYEPRPHGQMKLVAADFLVLSAAWHATNQAPPELMGQLFHLFDEPNRFGLPAFYTLHVWAWKENPQGTFANWNPKVSCDHYAGENP
jgi:hypothetical protein